MSPPGPPNYGSIDLYLVDLYKINVAIAIHGSYGSVISGETSTCIEN